jgi:hypothetical protein
MDSAKSKPQSASVTVTAGEVEAWTTGDGSPMEHEQLVDALIEQSEAVSRNGAKQSEVRIVIKE